MRLIERILGRIDAETVFDRLLDEGLGVDGAVHVIVQVGALGHALQEVMQSERVVADALELLHGALGGSGLHLLRRLRRGARSADQRTGNACREAKRCEWNDPDDTHGPCPMDAR